MALNDWVVSVVVLPDGKSLIDGYFTDAGGNPNTDYAARLGVTVPNVDTVDPASGPATGGTQVSIGGAGFDPAATAAIGGQNCAVVGTTTATTLTCVTAPHAPGTVDVTVTNPDGRLGTLTGAYTYQASPPPVQPTPSPPIQPTPSPPPVQPVAPSKVRGVKAVLRKHTVKIRWKPAAAATSYQVRISKPGAKKYRAWKTTTKRVFKAKVRKGTKYRFQVTGIGAGGRGPVTTIRFKGK